MAPSAKGGAAPGERISCMRPDWEAGKMLRLGGTDAADLHFDAAEIRVIVLADPVG
jgi:hypothetical protein